MSCARSAVSRVSYLSVECRVLQCAVRPSSQSRQDGGHTSPTSREQWAVFSWITVASSPLSSHWSAAPHHSTRQEAVTNRNDIFVQSEGWSNEVTHFQSHFLGWNQCSHLLGEKKKTHFRHVKKMCVWTMKTVYVVVSQWPRWKFIWLTVTCYDTYSVIAKNHLAFRSSTNLVSPACRQCRDTTNVLFFVSSRRIFDFTPALLQFKAG